MKKYYYAAEFICNFNNATEATIPRANVEIIIEK